MKRLLFVLCSLFAVQEVCARRPAVRFDLPYTVEHGKYVVVLGTPAGPRRFIFDTGSAGYFHFSYADSGDAPPPLWFIDSLRWADGYASAIGWTNRNRVNSHFRGTIPRFEIQGTAIADMPVKRTFGHNRILGCKLFDWGQVVLDFRRKRFLFIPRGGEAKAPPQPACNFTLALSAGQLVVGQVWDEALADVIAPGDRILSLDGHPWDGDVCRFLLDPDPLDGTVCGIGTASGQHVVLTIETMK